MGVAHSFIGTVGPRGRPASLRAANFGYASRDILFISRQNDA
jgi:hypothetical protein